MTDSVNGPALDGGLQLDGLKQEELFPIREVSRMTGINPVTLRAWERRYGLIQPTRTDSGHRLYSQADIEEVRSILGWIERGVAVSKVGKILAKASVVIGVPGAVREDGSLKEWAEWQSQVRRATRAFDERRLEQLYGQIFSTYPMIVVFQAIFMPVWQEFLLHQDQFGQASEWLFLDAFLRGRTLQRLQMSRGTGETAVLLAALPGECRELELWVAGLLLGTTGTSISVLALGQPLEELSLVCEKTQPQVLVLYSTHPPTADLPRRLQRLALMLDCPVLLAGEASDLAQDSLVGSPIACLGSDGLVMQRRLQQFLAGHLDS
ncbi:MerR family transcriptional regulator [Pseudomonas sp. CCI3.2]|uniref:MerR family transcriptional regulator n=1 Tax=unclassified Pseudomonas TaxID=196821 RepID=UPI002AC97086|nr:MULTISPECIES: MerR family transcriptional regulator [unclassified Pseudomonas]MEB0079912.1 MerR family transcriptional regulator [Pseudomonas sp. MH10out]MEB0103498.1 MerR family transcriptional regulator [Pseudomonas sp. CCI3.2]MEB0159832.1 MerR family transcriptional regulator [Pseudomonas sp. AH2 (2023)]MEB0169722.1 MerR family transcriptional regulator [Pseudomonas sp. CCC4.4]WPX28920.1 MerR family transcriptional regulator [Pseudomonas sp. AH2]